MEGNSFLPSTPIQENFHSSEEEKMDVDGLTVKIGKQTFDNAKQIERGYSFTGMQRNTFLTRDGNMEISTYNLNDNCFVISNTTDQPLYQSTNLDLSEDSMLADFQNYLSQYVDHFDYEAYQYSFTTSISCHAPNAAWREDKEGFYTPADDSESVIEYHISFVKYANGIPTADKTECWFDESGNIFLVYYFQHGVDWSECEVDLETLNSSLDSFFRQHCRYTFRSHHINSLTWCCVNGEIQLQVVAEVTFSQYADSESEFVMLCPLQITA